VRNQWESSRSVKELLVVLKSCSRCSVFFPPSCVAVSFLET